MSEKLEQEARGFQDRVDEWLLACFGKEIARDRIERNHRFLEEALELVQACGCTASEAHQLVDYTYGRPVGEPGQEVGGVMNTLAALCLAYGLDMAAEGDREIERCWQKIDRIREKQRNKPKHSPLPEASQTRPDCGREAALEEAAKWHDEQADKHARLQAEADARGPLPDGPKVPAKHINGGMICTHGGLARDHRSYAAAIRNLKANDGEIL